MVGRQHLIEPLLHHGLAVGARDTHYGAVELVAMAFGQSLQCCECGGDDEEVGLGKV